MADELEKQLGKHIDIEDVFESYDEYQKYFLKALGILKGGEKKRNPAFNKVFPEELAIQFDKSIKAPRYRIPRFEGTIILVLPDNGLSPKKKAAIRNLKLDAHVGVIKVNEMACADQIAVRMKRMESIKEKKRY